MKRPFLTKARQGLVAALGCVLPGLLCAQSHLPATTAVPDYPPPPPGIAVLHDVVIGKGGDRVLHAEVDYPQGATGLLPAVIWVHGGGWISGTNKPSPILQIAKMGYFAASIEYRTSNVAKWPAQIQDCKLGVRWLRANAGQYQVDPNHIGAWGASAGGHLVACLGTMSDSKFEGDGGYPGVSSAVQVVIDCFGPTDFNNYDPARNSLEANRVTESLFGVPYKQNPDLWKSASPSAYAKAGDPPIFIIHGDCDKTVPLAQATVFDAALIRAGVAHQFIVVKNCGHDFATVPGMRLAPGMEEIDKAIADYLAKYLKGS